MSEVEDPKAEAPTGQRVLVVADEAVTGSELAESLVRHIGDEPRWVFVVCPALADSALHHIMGDVDIAIAPAQERLEATLKALHDHGVEASGEVGDSDPLQAMSDEVLKFEPDEVVLIAHREKDAAFAEKGLLEQAKSRFELPVIELIVDSAPRPHVVDVDESAPNAGGPRGWRPSRNFPPLSRRDIFGIFVAALGTLILGVLAAKALGTSHNPGGNHEEGRLNASAVACVLIALGMALINAAHIVGLLLFQSVEYRGVFRQFFARLSLYATPVAVVVSLILVIRLTS
jgi:hypothetical protein